MLNGKYVYYAAEYRFYGFTGYDYGEVRFGAAEHVCAA
jgi:hypothetical protein